MPSEAAWHPAFMPNSAADIISKKAIPAPDRAPAPEPPAEAAKPVLPPLASSIDTQSMPGEAVLENGDVEHENNEAHPELGNLRSALSTSLASPGGVEFDDAPFHNGLSEEQIAQDKADFPSTGPSSSSKHVSTMSFARTVSEEVVLGEDDEVDQEWNLHRTDTDPFKLMAKSDRTNSFPQVPPAHSPADFSEVPSNQAADIIKEVEQEPRDLFSDDEHGGDADFFAQTAAQGASHEESNSFPSSFDQPLGSEVQREEDKESQARYEEGLPLVERSEPSQQTPGVHNAFEDDGEGGDDFFTQVSKAEPTTEQRPPLERKSTSQVLDSFNFQPDERIEPAVAEDPELEAAEESQYKGAAPSNSTALDALLAEEGEDAAAFELKPADGDLAEKWQAALGDNDFLDDDELLPDDEPAEGKALDPADVFGSDDEGFLEDTEEEAQAASQPAQVNGHPGSNRYLPATLPTPSAQPANSYAPSAPQFTDLSQSATLGVAPVSYGAPPPAAFPGQQVQPQRPELPKAESFANKNKGGYSSPYDLPMEVVKPKKRPSLQQMNRGYSNQFGGPSPSSPPRSASMYAQQPPPSRGSTTSLSPPTTGYGQQAPLQPPPSATGQAPPPSLKPKASTSSFFEDLPVSSRPKPVRQSTAPQPLVSQPPAAIPPPPATASYAPPPPAANYAAPPPATGYAAPPPAASYSAPPQQNQQAATQALVAPERVSPYASLPSQAPAVPATTSRYSPAPAQQQAQAAPAPPNAQSRYSPALARGGPAHAGASQSAPPAPLLPHLPRTSSPLAHFERSPDSGTSSTQSQTPSFDRRSSSSYESSLKPHHLPPTREVDEAEEANPPSATRPVSNTPPPPQTYATKPGQSPPRRTGSAYLPQQSRRVTPPHTVVPPKRSQTQSPGTAYTGNQPAAPLNPYQRPASTEVPYPPRAGAPQPKPSGRPRGLSTGFNYIAPTDGREHDPLQRWKGAPVFCWGVGGTFVTSFPKDVPRYMNQTPMTIRSPGEVKIRNIKDIDPLPERLSRFPGPLKGKSKKKEVIAWLNSGIQILEQNASHLKTSLALTHDDKRTEERILLWKILAVFVENDGILEGNPTVDAAVRAVLSPGLADSGDSAPIYATGADLSGISASKGGVTSDPVDPSAIDELRKFLLKGDREKAVWEAVDKRLWGHAMLISNTVSKDLFRQVAQEFVQKEVRTAGENTESLAALYEVFAGNFEESIDELVPPSARAGFQLVSASDASGPSKDALHGLDRWRETLGLVLSNRSFDDNKALNALGKLLSGYGRAEAGHICFLFARTHSIFGGIDDPASNVVLVGSDHIRQPQEFDKEMEPILLTEVFEYGLSLANTANVATTLTSHLSVYKLQHAKILAEYGYREQALQYCESIASAITSQTRRSPYHHKWLVAELDDFSQRLKQSPKDEKASWVSKPSIDKVSSSVWSTFNKFVAGDEADSGTPGSATGGSGEHGPFARLAGGTPTISRAPSAVDLYGSYAGGMPINGGAAPTKAGSRYAPGATLDPQSASYQSAPMYGSQPKNSFEDMQSAQYQPSYPSSYPEPGKLDPNFGRASPPTYLPQNGPNYAGASPYTPTNVESPLGQARTPYTPVKSALTAGLAAAQPAANQANQPPAPYEPSVPSYEPPSNSYEPPTSSYEPPSASYEPQPSSYEPPFSGYEPPTNGYEPPTGGYEPPTGGYEPPTSAYEPPAYEPATMGDEVPSDEPAPKKKSFMDDDDDDVPAAPAAPREKTKAEKDREADEAFRKAAEADAARAKEVVPKKSGWGLSGWFGGGAKKEVADAGPQPNKPIRAKLGEASSFVYDPELKRWINKKAGAEDTPAAAATPPPPKAGGPRRAVSGTPPSGPPGPTSAPRPMSAAGPPPSRSLSGPGPETNVERTGSAPPPSDLSVPPTMSRSVSNGSVGGPSGPPSRPGTSMSNASSIDDLLGPPTAGGRKGTTRGKKKGRGYVDVMSDKAIGS